MQVVEAWRSAGVRMADDQRPALEQTLDGATVVVTGSVPGFTRDQVKEAISERGGKAAGSVSAKTTVVVAGDNAGSKRQRAEELQIPIISPELFPALLEAGVEAALKMRDRDFNNS
jgi:DNA ligase (NAD+)